MVKNEIIKILQKVTWEKEVSLEFPSDESFGDYSTNIALQLKTQNRTRPCLGKDTVLTNPRQLAEEIKSKLDKSDELAQIVEKIEVAGPGFINFHLTKLSLVNELTKIQKEGEKYGSSDLGKGKTIVIDYSSPNIAKPFGIGHLRSTIIGQAIYNLYKTLGYTVVGDNHLGDWGTQFGKLLYMLHEENVTDYTIAKLEELYVKFHKLAEADSALDGKAREWFKRLEDNDPEAKSIWKKCVDVSIFEFDKVYKLLGVKIDYAFGESYYESEMKQMMDDSSFNKYLKKGEDGALIINLSDKGIETPLMYLKSDGATTYATRDLATVKFRERKWNPDIIIYEVGAEQILHFRQVFAAAKLTGLIKDDTELIHTAHGLYLAPDGKKFSTRKGKTIKLDEVLSEAIERAEKLGEGDKKVAEQVGIGAIKYFDLMHSVQSDVVFEWEKVMNMEGNSGPYLQYTVARCNSVLNKSSKSMNQLVNKLENDKLKMENEEELVLRTLIKFPEIIQMAAKSYSPNLLCNYLYELSQKFNGFYAKNKIIGSENESFRLLLTQATGQVLKNGLKLLGIQAPERM